MFANFITQVVVGYLSDDAVPFRAPSEGGGGYD